MGNKGFNHRVPALTTACLSSAGLALTTLAGTSCSFVAITAKPDMFLVSFNKVALSAESGSIGILCENEFYGAGDPMWELSRLFLIISLAFGSTTTALAWSVSTFLPPSETNWRLQSFLSSLAAVMQIPIFLVFESAPCADYLSRQQCTLSIGAYYLIVSTVCWVAVTMCTQCLDPPLWAIELKAWRVQCDGRTREIPEEYLDDEYFNILSIQPDNSKAEAKHKRRRRWFPFFANNTVVEAVRTESTREDENDQEAKDASYYDGSIDSRLMLRVQPYGKPHGDEAKSSVSFEDLDSVIEMAETGRMSDLTKRSLTKTVLRIRNDTQSNDIQPIGKSSPTRVTIVRTSPGKRMKALPGSPSQGVPSNMNTTQGTATNTPSPVRNPKAPMSGGEILADLESSRSFLEETDTKLLNGDSTKAKWKDSYAKGLHGINRKSGGILADLNSSDTKPLNEESPKAKLKDSYAKGLRAITKKLKKDTKRRRFLRQNRRGYAHISDDEDSDDSDFWSPPIEVRIQPSQMIESEKIANELSDDENFDLIDDWNNLHAAETAGVRKGVQEGSLSSYDMKESLDASFDSYQSDPEPVYHSSDESRSCVSLSNLEEPPSRTFIGEDDNSTLSSYSAPGTSSKESPRSRPRTGRIRKRNRGQSVGSLKSGGSLLEMTIEEETDVDILEESSVGEDDLGASYSLTRTNSAPEPRGRSQEKISKRRLRRPTAMVPLPTAMAPARPVPYLSERDINQPPEEKKDDSDTSRSSDHLFKPISEAEARMNSPCSSVRLILDAPGLKRMYYPVFDEENVIPTKPKVPRSRSSSASPSFKKHVETRSLSPSRTNRLQPVEWRVGRATMHSKSFTAEEDSFRQPSYLSQRARDYRIRRLQEQKAKMDPMETGIPIILDDQQLHKNCTPVVRKRGAPLNPKEKVADAVSRRDTMSHSSNGSNGLVVDSESFLRIFPDFEDSRVDKELILQTFNDSNGRKRNDSLLVAQSLLNSKAGKPIRNRNTPLSSDDEVETKYGSSQMDTLDLQLIQVRRPIGAEYGDDEVSL